MTTEKLSERIKKVADIPTSLKMRDEIVKLGPEVKILESERNQLTEQIEIFTNGNTFMQKYIEMVKENVQLKKLTSVREGQYWLMKFTEEEALRKIAESRMVKAQNFFKNHHCDALNCKGCSYRIIQAILGFDPPVCNNIILHDNDSTLASNIESKEEKQ